MTASTATAGSTDWPAVVDTALAILVEAGIIESAEDEVETTPWDDPGWRAAALDYHRDRDGRGLAVEIEPKRLVRLRRLMAPGVTLDRAWHELHAMRPKGIANGG